MYTPEKLSKQESDCITRKRRDADSELSTVKWRRQHWGLLWSRKASWKRRNVNCSLKDGQEQDGRRGTSWTQSRSQALGLSQKLGV